MFIAHIPIGLCLARLVTKRKLTAPIITIAAFGAIFPDLDLLRFYALDNQQIHHHAYWTHLPVYWIGIIAIIFIGLKLLRRRLPMYLTVFFTAVMSHLILDSVAGDIRWLWPFTDEGFQLVTVPTTHTKWYMSFFHHWTFKLEICISILGLLVAGFNDGHKNPKEPS